MSPETKPIEKMSESIVHLEPKKENADQKNHGVNSQKLLHKPPAVKTQSIGYHIN